MTHEDFRAWVARWNRAGLTRHTLARELGIGRRTLYGYLRGEAPVPGPLALATVALEAHLQTLARRCNRPAKVRRQY